MRTLDQNTNILLTSGARSHRGLSASAYLGKMLTSLFTLVNRYNVRGTCMWGQTGCRPVQVTQILTRCLHGHEWCHQWPSISSVSIVLSCTCVSQSEPELGRQWPMRGRAGESPDQMQRIHHTRTAGDSLPNYFKMSPDIDSKWSTQLDF